MKERGLIEKKCGDCKDYYLRPDKSGVCKGWVKSMCWVDVDPNKTQIDNLKGTKGSNRIAYWLVRNVFIQFSRYGCFRPKKDDLNFRF